MTGLRIMKCRSYDLIRQSTSKEEVVMVPCLGNLKLSGKEKKAITTEQKLIKAKPNLLELGAYLGNVSEACRTQGYSRDTFYRLKKKYDEV